MIRVAACVLIGALLMLLATTYLALESGGVVTVRSVSVDDGSIRETHVWSVSAGSELYLEAGHPDNGWVRDVAREQRVELIGEGLDGPYVLEMLGPASHERIRELMRQRYGWRDWWVALMFDTSKSVMVRARPAAP